MKQHYHVSNKCVVMISKSRRARLSGTGAKHLVLHECGLFFHQELHHFLFKCLSLMIISIKPSTELHSPFLRLQELFRLPVFPGLELLHHVLSHVVLQVEDGCTSSGSS